MCSSADIFSDFQIFRKMEIYKPLRDWELSILAERMSPMEFDLIALQHLKIRKVSHVINLYLDGKVSLFLKDCVK